MDTGPRFWRCSALMFAATAMLYPASWEVVENTMYPCATRKKHKQAEDCTQ